MRAECSPAGETGSVENHGYYRELLAANYPLVQQIVGLVARRHWLSADEREELGSLVRLRMVENDYAVLRQWKRRSALKTYLTTVIRRIHLDTRTARWGRWRPSARARRLGPVAVRLEILTGRDGLSVGEASEMLRTNDGVIATREELERLYVQLPHRVPRRRVSDVTLENIPAPEPGGAADPRLSQLRAAIAALPDYDRRLLQLIYAADLRVAEVARICGVEAATLYRQLARLRRQLRTRVAPAVRDPCWRASRRSHKMSTPITDGRCPGYGHFERAVETSAGG